ncbi:MAG: hypothetical protein QXJ99_02430 [Thermofilum sp.]
MGGAFSRLRARTWRWPHRGVRPPRRNVVHFVKALAEGVNGAKLSLSYSTKKSVGDRLQPVSALHVGVGGIGLVIADRGAARSIVSLFAASSAALFSLAPLLAEVGHPPAFSCSAPERGITSRKDPLLVNPYYSHSQDRVGTLSPTVKSLPLFSD